MKIGISGTQVFYFLLTVGLGAELALVFGTDAVIPEPVEYSAPTPQATGSPESQQRAPVNLAEITERPLFFEGRRYPVDAPPPEALAPEPPTEVPVPAVVEEVGFKLYGLRAYGSQKSVLIAASADGEPAWLSEGSMLGGWTVSNISSTRVLLTHGEVQKVLTVYPDAP